MMMMPLDKSGRTGGVRLLNSARTNTNNGSSRKTTTAANLCDFSKVARQVEK